jgi:hypothetical protein
LSELEEHWTNALAEAERRARAMGRQDIAEYVALRSTNDRVRRTAVDWLLTTFSELAADENRKGASLQIDQIDAHRFRIGQATMVGRLLTLRFGARSLQIEAGWPRTAPDGFIRGGGFACAHIKHVGRPNLSDELLLRQSAGKAPHWEILKKTGERVVLTSERIAIHVAELLKI